MSIRPDEISSLIKQQIEGFETDVQAAKLVLLFRLVMVSHVLTAWKTQWPVNCLSSLP
ncbi:hypothetical protein [Sinobaca sp. H24]|uniref:hypothetical protein n=1 Tax=Sinobaca sp. H24 TaxID=2923376 RepID=UPI00207A5992|nr:hypothetical protein [Sinobaca sp. H24]